MKNIFKIIKNLFGKEEDNQLSEYMSQGFVVINPKTTKPSIRMGRS